MQFTGITPCDAFNRVVTADFASASTECSETIRKSWKSLSSILSKGKLIYNLLIFQNPQNILSFITLKDEGKEWVRTHWNLCVPLNGTDDVINLKDWLTNVWTNLAMVNYPYAANFLAPLPAYPVKVHRHMPISILKNKLNM